MAAHATAIIVHGHTDRAGPESYNMELSLRRALAARAELVRLGVPTKTISFSGAGEAAPRIPTADGIREARNRTGGDRDQFAGIVRPSVAKAAFIYGEADVCGAPLRHPPLEFV